MLDLKTTLQNLDEVRTALENRGLTVDGPDADVDLDALVELDERRRELIQTYDTLRHAQREAQKDMRTIDKKSEAFVALRDRLRKMSGDLKAYSSEQTEVETALDERLLYLPNIPHDDVPVGQTEEDNEEVLRHGERPTFDFDAKPHFDLGPELGVLDFERGAKVAGARFTFLRGGAARLNRALIQMMLDLHTAEHGYVELLPPFLVNRDSMTGTGQLPKFEADAFKTDNDLFLVPTAEVPVTNMHRDEILDAEELPLRYVAYTPCFRLEAGSHGQDTRGLIRQHQFDKVELVRFVEPEHSYDALEELLDNACEVLRRLELPFRVVTLCTGDLGFAAAKCYDIEVWIPTQDTYREISSCSNFEAFQARRANVRYRPAPGEKPRFVHTLNGSGLAIGRTLVAILENFQQADGTVAIPDALRPYMGGQTHLEPVA